MEMKMAYLLCLFVCLAFPWIQGTSPSNSSEEIINNSTLNISSSGMTNETEEEEEEEEEHLKPLSLSPEPEQIFMQLYPDPIIQDGQAYAVAWIYENVLEEAKKINFSGEVRFIQGSPSEVDVNVNILFINLEPNQTYQVYIAEYGDLVSYKDNDNLTSPCDGGGKQFMLEDELGNGTVPSMLIPFESDANGTAEWNQTTTLAPLWYRKSVVGRMVVLQMETEEKDDHDMNWTSRYTPPDKGHRTVGCGVIGIGSTFNVSNAISFASRLNPNLNLFYLLAVLSVILTQFSDLTDDD